MNTADQTSTHGISLILNSNNKLRIIFNIKNQAFNLKFKNLELFQIKKLFRVLGLF